VQVDAIVTNASNVLSVFATKCELVSDNTSGLQPPLLIPRIFHFIWFGVAIPSSIEATMAQWRALHEGWETKLWHSGNLPPITNGAAFENAQDYSEKSDVLRYEIVLRFGGVYVGALLHSNLGTGSTSRIRGCIFAPLS
jgi:hypothetical protein